MSKKIEEFFQTPDEFNHPKAKQWSELIKSGGEVKCEIYRKRQGFNYSPAKIYIHIERKNNERITDDDDWDYDLNQFLIKNKIRAITAENEQLRFSLCLKDLFKKPEIRYGAGYFNSVLMELVVSAFNDELKNEISSIPWNSPNKGNSYEECQSMIIGVIKLCAINLAYELSYKLDIAQSILAHAMGLYLDERFSITNRKRMGLK